MSKQTKQNKPAQETTYGAVKKYVDKMAKATLPENCLKNSIKPAQEKDRTKITHIMTDRGLEELPAQDLCDSCKYDRPGYCELTASYREDSYKKNCVSYKPAQEKKWDWEKRFDELPEDWKQDPDDIYIKAFIRQLLAEQKQGIVEEIEKIFKKENWKVLWVNYNNEYDGEISWDEIIKRLKQ